MTSTAAIAAVIGATTLCLRRDIAIGMPAPEIDESFARADGGETRAQLRAVAEIRRERVAHFFKARSDEAVDDHSFSLCERDGKRRRRQFPYPLSRRRICGLVAGCTSNSCASGRRSSSLAAAMERVMAS